MKTGNSNSFKWLCIAVPAILLMGVIVFGAISEVRAAEDAEAKTLVVFYSKTGSTKTACQIIKKAYSAEVVEIKDMVDRFTTWGTITGMIYSLLGWHTDIEPKSVDISPYKRIVIGTPIWGGSFPPAMRTFVETHDFQGKDVAIFSTSTDVIEKGYRDEMKETVTAANGKVVGYFQIQADRKVGDEKEKKSNAEIEQETGAVIVKMQKAL
jgi:flavodoxin